MTSPTALDLTDRIVLVTGSSRGLGFGLARSLAESGATVVLNARREDRLAEAARRLRDEGHRIHQFAFDVCDEAAVVAAIQSIEDGIGPIEVLVNNAGIQQRGPFLDFAVDDFRRLVEANLVSAFIVAKSAGARMAARGHGKIINICSVQAELGRATIAPYSATKGGLRMLTRGMCAELGPLGIQVNAIAPGYFATDLTAALVDDAEFSAWLVKRTPAGRWGTAEDLGGAVVLFASAASDFINGQILFVDGGLTAVV